MMESAEFRHRRDLAAVLYLPSQRRIFVESEVGPISVVVFGIVA